MRAVRPVRSTLVVYHDRALAARYADRKIPMSTLLEDGAFARADSHVAALQLQA
jgi:hypothetical protein